MKIIKHLIFYILPFLLFCCGTKTEGPEENQYLRWVDDIPFDPSRDSQEFKICHGEDSVLQYFNNGLGLEYEGEKYAIKRAFKEHYDEEIVKKENGLIRIRFIVNCNGETGRFRLIAMDENYNKKEFDSSITNQILQISKDLNGWQPMVIGDLTGDYYQYLIFKIEQGRVTKILP